MSILDPYISNSADNDNVHLRDARHAHQLFTEHSFAFAPKVKFLYHVVFDLQGPLVRQRAPNTDKFRKEIGVLAKNVDLPSFKANLEVKQQYNRKKIIQTRINYDEIRMSFHDDNVGVTRALLQEYYNYYYRDGTKDNGFGTPVDFSPRDKFSSTSARYGLDNETKVPFFKFIKIFQLSRHNWHSYTLINPILSAWQHDTLDYAESGIMQNVINVAYEGVLYNNGEIGTEPAGFTDQETRYDQVHSPLTTNTTSIIQVAGPLLNTKSTSTNPMADAQIAFASNNNPSSTQNTTTIASIIASETQQPGSNQNRAPIIDTQNTIISSVLPAANRSMPASKIALAFATNPALKKSVATKAIAANAYAIPGVKSLADFNSLTPSQQAAVVDDISDLASNGDNPKIQQLASDVISNNSPSITTTSSSSRPTIVVGGAPWIPGTNLNSTQIAAISTAKQMGNNINALYPPDLIAQYNTQTQG